MTGCHQGRVQGLDQRQEAQPEAQDPICPTGRVALCQPHAFSAGDGVAWKGSTRGHSVATITLSDAGGGSFAEPLPTAPYVLSASFVLKKSELVFLDMVAQLTCKEQIYKEFRALFCMVGENDLCVKHVCFCDKSRLGQKPLMPAAATGHTKITGRAVFSQNQSRVCPAAEVNSSWLSGACQPGGSCGPNSHLASFCALNVHRTPPSTKIKWKCFCQHIST